MQVAQSSRQLTANGARWRWFTLVAVLLLGVWLNSLIGAAQEGTSARWPADNALYAIGSWRVGPAKITPIRGGQEIAREYRRADGMSAAFLLTASPEAKIIYRAGADVGFKGAGFEVQPAPDGLVPPSPTREALVISREGKQYLVLAAFGERRGLLGNGVQAWTMAILDGLLGRPNDYFKAFLVVPFDRPESPTVREIISLADTLFPRLAAWYAE